MAERLGKKRDLAIIQTLRHTCLRVGELCDLRLDDIDADVRHALGVNLAVRPPADSPERTTMQRVAQLFRAKGRHVTVLTEERIAAIGER